MFNKYFLDQFSNSSTYDTDIDFSNDDAFDIDFSCTRIKNLLDDININKAPGPDGIHGCVLKHCSISLCRPLSIRFKLSYNTGIIPTDWKSANIVPIYKKGDKAVVSNYRPISLICLTAKIMERIIQDELLTKTQESISSEQHGFLSSRSCNSNLISLTDNIASNLYNDIGTDIIYFDFAKAFDSVNHDLLLNKLKNKFNIDARLFKFLVNYLKNRRQRVTLENVFSDYLPVQSGVPQGSILGPLLFVLFINDISSRINPKTNITLFADDTKIWRPMESEEDCTILQRDIDYLNNWCKLNQMKFHPDKCKVVSIISKINRLSFLRLLPQSRFSYTLDDRILDYETQEKDLGVIVNDSLTWCDHHLHVINKASQMFGLIKRTCHFVINSTRKRTSYLAMIRSQFEHCSIIWRPVTDTHLDKFESLKKNAIKWILNEIFVSYSDKEIYLKKCKLVNLLPINKKFDLNDLIFFYKIIDGYIKVKLPNYVNKFNRASRLRNNHLDSECYVCHLNNHNCFQRSPLFQNFYYRVTYKWNKLPCQTKISPNIATFKSKVIEFLWSEAFNEI